MPTSDGDPRLPALSPSASLRLPLIRRCLSELSPPSVLEVGCGMGAMACRLAMRYEYRGYEPDPTSFQVARRRLDRLGVDQIFNSAVPDTPDRTFDLLAAFEVLEHIEDDHGALKKWCRWIEPGGHVLLSVPANPNRFGPADRLVGHWRRYTRGELAALMEDAHLQVRSILSWGMPAGYLLEAVRNFRAKNRNSQDAVGTPGSGRLHQPPGLLGRSVEVAFKPLAALQRPFTGTDLGIGFVAMGRMNRSP